MTVSPTRFDYFVVQTRAESNPAGVVLSGVIEHLATGEKRTFRSGDELARLLREWQPFPPKDDWSRQS